MKKAIVPVVFSLLVVGWFGTLPDAEERAWRKASDRNDHRAYSLYLDEWPDGEHAADARRLFNLHRRSFRGELLDRRTLESIELFRREFPDESDLADEIRFDLLRRTIEENRADLAWLLRALDDPTYQVDHMPGVIHATITSTRLELAKKWESVEGYFRVLSSEGVGPDDRKSMSDRIREIVFRPCGEHPCLSTGLRDHFRIYAERFPNTQLAIEAELCAKIIAGLTEAETIGTAEAYDRVYRRFRDEAGPPRMAPAWRYLSEALRRKTVVESLTKLRESTSSLEKYGHIQELGVSAPGSPLHDEALRALRHVLEDPKGSKLLAIRYLGSGSELLNNLTPATESGVPVDNLTSVHEAASSAIEKLERSERARLRHHHQDSDTDLSDRSASHELLTDLCLCVLHLSDAEEAITRDRAVQICDEALRLDPTSTRAMVFGAFALTGILREGASDADREAAVKKLRRALSLDPDCVTVGMAGARAALEALSK